MKPVTLRRLTPIALLLSLSATAQTIQGNWYVDPVSGSDGNGATCATAAAPCKTLTYATTQVQGPGTIHISSGDLYESDSIRLPLQVSLKGAGRSATTIHPAAGFPAQTAMIMIVGNAAALPESGQTLSGFTIDGSLGSTRHVNIGIDVLAVNGVIVSGAGIINCVDRGVAFSRLYNGSTPITVADYMSNFAVVDSYFSNSASSAPGKGWANGNVYADGVNHLVIARNTINTAESFGFGIKGANVANVQVFANTITTAKTNTISGDSDIGIELWGIDTGEIYNNSSTGSISVPGAKNLNVHHNILKAAEPGAGLFSVEIGGQDNTVHSNYIENLHGMLIAGTTDSLHIHNNVFSNMTAGGILVNAAGTVAAPEPITNVNIFNNTFDTIPHLYNSGAIATRIQEPAATVHSVNIKNNILTNSLTAPPITITGADGGIANITTGNTTNVVVDSNLEYNALPDPSPGNIIRNFVPIALQNNLFADPQYASGFNPATMSPFSKFSLAAGSPALGSGVNVGLPFLGNQPDRGAFIQPTGGVIEAEMNYSVQKQNGSYLASLGAFQSASAGKGVSFLNFGDVIRIHFYIPADGSYNVQARMRSGDTSSSTGYFTAGTYAFSIDGVALQTPMVPDHGSVSSPIDPAGGGVYWGTWNSGSAVPLKKGMHSIEITANTYWAFIDYVNVY